MKLSVALCTFNGEKYLSEQLDSILRQSLLPDELVISDDGSSDHTLPMVEEFGARAPFSVKIFRRAGTPNYTLNFIDCISRCAGEVIALCDQDDVWLPARLADPCRIFKERPEVGLVIAPAMCTDDQLRPSGTILPTGTHPRGAAPHQALGLWFRPPGLTLTFRAAPVLRFLKLPRVLSYWGQGPAPFDEWTAFLASIQSDTVVLPRYQILYRRHAGVTTGDPRVTSGVQFALHQARRENHKEIAARTYQHMAAVAQARAALIAKLATEAEPSAQRRMQALPDFYSRVAATQLARAELYLTPSRLRRVTRWSKLLSRGGYRGRSRGGLGLRSFLKDGWMALK
jgi:hypothetical protein